MPKTSKNKEEIIEAALAGGLVGAAIGALLTGKSRGAIAAGLVGVAIGASVKALEEAKQLDRPLLYKEGDVIYRKYPDGRREVVKKINGPKQKIPSKFSIG